MAFAAIVVLIAAVSAATAGVISARNQDRFSWWIIAITAILLLFFAVVFPLAVFSGFSTVWKYAAIAAGAAAVGIFAAAAFIHFIWGRLPENWQKIAVGATGIISALAIALLLLFSFNPFGGDGDGGEVVSSDPGGSGKPTSATSIAGRVIDTSDNPVEGASVRASGPYNQSGQEAEHHEAFTDHDGLYKIPLPMNGEYELLVNAEGFEQALLVSGQDIEKIVGDLMVDDITLKKRSEIVQPTGPSAYVYGKGVEKDEVARVLMAHGIINSFDEINEPVGTNVTGEGWTTYIRDGQSISTQPINYVAEPFWKVTFRQVRADGLEVVYVQRVCGNITAPPGEVVIRPIPTPPVGPTPPPPPGVTSTPTPPGATPTPPPTTPLPTPTPPTTTPTPTPTPPTGTPTPTPTPVPPDFRVLAEGADRELNYRDGLIQYRANVRVVVFSGSTADIAPFTYRWYVDEVFQGSNNPILFWVWPGNHEMYAVVKDKFGRERESNHIPFRAGSIPPSPVPGHTPTPAPTPIPGGSDDDDDGCTGGCMP